MPFVCSTMSSDVAYTEWYPRNQGQQFDVPKRRVLIKGGHGVASGRALITPQGVVTEVTDDELAFLETEPTFQAHKKAGFIVVTNNKKNPEKIIPDMVTFDRTKDATPLVPQEFKTTEKNVVKLDNIGAF